MQHQIDAAKFGPRGTAMASVVQSCVHCGLCLPACPTYQVLGEEMDSPRGRIYLMKNVLEGELPAAEAQPYLDRCLGCWACVPACPSGVAYGELLTHYRAATADQRQAVVAGCGHAQDAGGNAALSGAVPQSVGAQAGSGAPCSGCCRTPGEACWTCCRPRLPASDPLPDMFPARTRRRARVALLTGCVQSVLRPKSTGRRCASCRTTAWRPSCRPRRAAAARS